MKFNLLDDWLTFLESNRPESVIELGLGRVGLVADTLDLRKPARHCLLVAGTNGKGSTAIFAEALLLAQGYSVGTTLSPHLFRFNERIRMGGQVLADASICEAFNAVEHARLQTRQKDQNTPHLTYFEFAVLAALYLFKSSAVDFCILEVGLGGRLDASNIVDADVSIITSIGLDHIEILGDNREDIAVEKAGIMRRDKPCVYGEFDMPDSVANCAEKIGAPLLRAGLHYRYAREALGWCFQNNEDTDFANLPLPTVSLANAAAAIEAVCRLTTPRLSQVTQACKTAYIPGRYEHFNYRGIKLVLDVAHNPPAAAFLAKQLQDQPGQKTAVIAGFLSGKDVAGTVAALKNEVDYWIFVDTGSGGYVDRAQCAADSEQLARVQLQSSAEEQQDDRICRVIPELETALNYYLSATHRPDRVVIMGSFDIVQQARELLKSR